ncbi:MAG: DUF3108 domain-containing protein [Alphaproteobacteria bacterium]|nr:DUF3108 domain-containing protein [Alphaproteobacteria bacterium]
MPKVSVPSLLAALTVWLLNAAQAAEKPPGPSVRPAHVSVEYALDFIGIPFGHTNYDIHISRDSYRASSHFETRGIVSAFWESTIDASASGQFTPAGMLPREYDSYHRRGQKRQRVKLTYGTDRIPLLVAEPPYDVHKYPVTDAQKKEGIDPVSNATAILAGLSQSAAKPCGTTAAVFDGRRRYDIDFTWLRDEPVKLQNGLFDGKAHLCLLHYNQIAGFKPKILKEGRALPPAYVLLGEIPSAGSSRGHYLVPLKLWAWTGFGTVTGTLTQMNIEEETSTKD